MSTTALEPRIVDGPALTIAGLRKHYTFENRHEIPALWMEFGPQFGSFPGQVGMVAYGVCTNLSDSGFDYMASFEVGDASAVSAQFTTIEIPARLYAVFAHNDHISKLGGTLEMVHAWFQASTYDKTPLGPDVVYLMERYDDEFDPQVGIGHVEIWVPIRK